MGAMKFSIVIPYKDRLANMSLALESLSHQTLPTDEFEVVVGVMENSPQYAQLCRKFENRLNIVSVVSAKKWQLGLARNMAMRLSSGQIIVLLDADMVLPDEFLVRLWNEHYSNGENQCVVGQMIDYSNNDTDVTVVDHHPYNHYKDRLEAVQAKGPGESDLRLQFDHIIPWAYAWTALIALPRESVERHELTFDLNFWGYGVEDLEWAHRISAAGIPIVMSRSAFGIHLPHVRSLADNKKAEAVNYRYFVKKWPSIEVELAACFGDFEANQLINPLRQELDQLLETGKSFASVCATRGEVRSLYLGALISADGSLEGLPEAEPNETREAYPLIGLALPFGDKSFHDVITLAPVRGLSHNYRKAVQSEAIRVCEKTNATELNFAAHTHSL
ncbi:glycosyltransferase family 2 protein [Arthrobacter sp. ISL-48]|uniref:glycosyltransferase family 2 protein n=1 Tax=Arthrobacter sp. ISL-48 TaxID=2819110 RepID=UPI001BE87CC8|nr:glycosyltransferase [Arthrobacter sp. ISL-48]MBT2533973.1 glycosyltransferase family 2 protein [Arthrobacter sp. ISL-48]